MRKDESIGSRTHAAASLGGAISRLLRLAVPIPLTILGLGRAIVFRLALRLPEAQELDASGTTSLRKDLLDAIQMRLQILISWPVHVGLRDLVIEVRQSLGGGWRHVS